MNNDISYPKRQQDCPYMPDLLENRKLKHELERERKRREEAEKHSLPFTIFNGLLTVLLIAAITFLISHSGQNSEEITAYTRLVYGYAALFFSVALAFLAINFTLGRHNDSKKHKVKSKSNEENNHV